MLLCKSQSIVEFLYGFAGGVLSQWWKFAKWQVYDELDKEEQRGVW